jgi:branched-chain amino acid transport system substrate-binding protein
MMKCICFLPLVVILAGCGSGPALPPIYLGHVATTSGPGRSAGVQEALGIRLAIEEMSRDGQNLVGGRPVNVKHVDARGQLENVQGEAVRLVTLSRVIALYGGSTKAQVLHLEPARVPLVTPLGGRPQGLTELIFTTGVSLAAQADALARFAVQEKSVKQMAIFLDQRLDESRALAEVFERSLQKALEEKKLPFAKPTVIPFGKEPKFAELSQTLDAKQTEGVLFVGTEEEYINWRKATTFAGVSMLLGGDDETAFDSSLGPVYCARAFAVDPDLPRTVAFAKKFQENFKEEPGVAAALAYDGIQMLIDAMKRAQGPTAEHLLEELRKTKDFPGLTGPLSFGPDQQLRRPIFVGRQVGTVFASEKRLDP